MDSSWLEDEESSEEEEKEIIATRRSKRNTTKTVAAAEHHSDASSDESYEYAEQSEEDPEYDVEKKEEHKIGTVMAVKTVTLAEWKDVTRLMNTTAIFNGSRWAPGTPKTENQSKSEQRFLVKWRDLSYLHVSWETERDLVASCPGARQHLRSFRKIVDGSDGSRYLVDERLDGVS